MKYRIDGPAYEDAPEVWEIVDIDHDRVLVICFTSQLATRIFEMLEADEA